RHDVERAREVVERAEGDARAAGGGRDHARDGLVVVAAHVREGQPVRVEVGVELADANAGLGADEAPLGPGGAKEVRLAGGNAREPVGPQEEAGRERDVGPRMARADRADGHPGPLRLAHDLRDLVDRLRSVDPQRIDGLVAEMVPPGGAGLVREVSGHHDPRSTRSRSTPRSASAAIVFEGLTPRAVGTIEPSRTYSPS